MNRSQGAKVILKARPLPAQVADRLAPPLPDGLEFYLDSSDMMGDYWLERAAAAVPPASDKFDYVVEGPLRSLDGAFFDAALPNEANCQVLERLVTFGRRIGARAAVIHAMCARPSADSFDVSSHNEALEKALVLFRRYADLCLGAGLVPTVENVPPIARMRESRFMYSLIGTPPADIVFLVRNVPELRVTLDVSHAQLYVNAFNADLTAVSPDVARMVAYIKAQDGVSSLDRYLDLVEEHLFEAHISNASGLLGEGLPYGDGDLDLDNVIRRLDRSAELIVTETIEADPNSAVLMREAQRRIAAALGRDLMRG